MTTPAAKRRFTVDEYHRMVKAGILSEDERIELLDGDIVEMSPISSRHAGCVNWLNRIFSERLASRAIVSIQNPVTARESEPRPDVAILRPSRDRYRTAHPGPSDIVLLLEIADSSTEIDRRIKIPLYAQAGIPEVWLIVLEEQFVERHRLPETNGYGSIERLFSNQTIAPGCLPDPRRQHSREADDG